MSSSAMKTFRSYGWFLALLALGAAWFIWQSWTEPSRPKVVALVQLTEVDRNTVAGFKAGMQAAGYRENSDVVYLEPEPAGTVERLEPIIRAHLAQQPDLFLVSSTPASQAVARLTRGRDIPVVFAPVNDPVGAGLVTDLKHPGGWITGIRLPTGDDLRLHWLTEIVPGVRRVCVPYSPDDKSARTTLAGIAEAAPRLGVELRPAPVNDAMHLKAILNQLPADTEAIFLPRDSRVEAAIADIVAVAGIRRLPISAPSLIQVQAGALFSYGFVHGDIGRQAAHLADQIFKGVAPGDLPVEMAENVLAINLATARRIGVEISDAVLLQADRVVRASP